MAVLQLQQGESILAKAQAQLAKGFPQTAGDLYLTNFRLVLEPNQLSSLGMGKRWDVPLSRIVKAGKFGSFKGGSIIGGAGRKLSIDLDDSSRHVIAFYLNSNIDAFHDALLKQIGSR